MDFNVRDSHCTVRFFDVYIPELNLIVEADGEHWHQNVDRLAIDRAKTEAAILEGYNFLRVSDRQFKRKFSCADSELLISLIKLPSDEQLILSNELLNARELALQQS